MPETNEQFSRRLLEQLLRLGKDYAHPAVKYASWQLAEALTTYIHTDRPGGKLYVPHYWALYVHEGRGPFGAPSPHYPGRPATILCWFKDPKDDPRLNDGKAPERMADVRRLTKDEFRDWVDKNKKARAAAPAGTDPDTVPVPMIITKYVSKSVAPVRFFSNEPGGGMAGFRPLAADLIKRMFSQHVEDYMGKLMKINHRGVTVRIL